MPVSPAIPLGPGRQDAGDRVIIVPKAAAQAIGDRQVVFAAAKDEQGRFIQRTVRLAFRWGKPTRSCRACIRATP